MYSGSPTAEKPYFEVKVSIIDNKQDIIIKGNIEDLNCNNRQLTYLDVSKCLNLKNLYCENNQLKQLNIDKNINLNILSCAYNNIVNLTVDKNINLVVLTCDNNELKNLNVDKNINLSSLSCSNNLLYTLNLSNNKNLYYLYCSNNKLPLNEIIKILGIILNGPRWGEYNISNNLHTDFTKPQELVDILTKVKIHCNSIKY